MPEEDRKPGPWSIAKSITSGEPETTNIPEPEKPENLVFLPSSLQSFCFS